MVGDEFPVVDSPGVVQCREILECIADGNDTNLRQTG